MLTDLVLAILPEILYPRAQRGEVDLFPVSPFYWKREKEGSGGCPQALDWLHAAVLLSEASLLCVNTHTPGTHFNLPDPSIVWLLPVFLHQGGVCPFGVSTASYAHYASQIRTQIS